MTGVTAVNLTPDLWTAGLKGHVGEGGTLSPINIGFDDIWDNLDLAWEVFGGLGYQVTDWILLFGGYRHQDIDHERRVTFDARMSGPLIGAQFQF